LREIQTYFQGQSNNERGFLLTQGKEFKPETQEKAAEVKKRLALLEGLAKTAEEKELLKKISDTHTQFTENSFAVMDTLSAGNADEARRLSFEVGRKVRKDLNISFDQLAKIHEDRAKSNVTNAESLANKAKLIIIATSGVAIIFSILLGFFLARNISKPINSLVGVMQKVADGDLRQDIVAESRDEIGQLVEAFTRMIVSLRVLVQGIQNNAEHLAESTEQLTTSAEQSALANNQIVSSINEVSLGSESQVSAVGDTSSIVDNIIIGMTHVAENANVVAKVSEDAKNNSQKGMAAVDSAISQMSTIAQTVNHSAEELAKLGERSIEIGQIVETISGIAGQTNLLALNAAIEAARAGEQGRGFAVVADEVRKLAEQSKQAAGQIATLVQEIQNDTNKAVVAMNEGTREVQIGAEIVNTAGQSFNEIANLIKEVSSQVTEISQEILEVANGSNKIKTSVQEIAKISQINAGQTQAVSAATEEQSASMQEMAASSEALAKMAQDLQGLVKRFSV